MEALKTYATPIVRSQFIALPPVRISPSIRVRKYLLPFLGVLLAICTAILGCAIVQDQNEQQMIHEIHSTAIGCEGSMAHREQIGFVRPGPINFLIPLQQERVDLFPKKT